ncbi:MAG TPA: hypothetical protein VK696_07460 [Steroidobacteraceae bacterium]|jgi:hypothetical protein|nr:hypothetical protein [Steroidobacteraceae bacterium]
MTQIHLIGGEKGGVGKSMVARLLAQYFIDHSIPFTGFDADRAHGALLRFYSGYASPVQVDEYESLDAIVEAASSQPERRIVVDLAARTGEPLTRWMDESQLLAVAAELNLHIRYWHVMDSGRDSVDLLRQLFERHQSRLNYVVVQNQLRGSDFRLFDESGLAAQAQAHHATLISIPQLNESTMIKIDAASSSFWAATQDNDQTTGLAVLERQRLKSWLQSAYAAIAAVNP